MGGLATGVPAVVHAEECGEFAHVVNAAAEERPVVARAKKKGDDLRATAQAARWEVAMVGARVSEVATAMTPA